MDIKEALSELDVMDDDVWTADGLPKLEVLKSMVGENVTRQQVLDVAPYFTKDNPVVDDPNDEAEDTPSLGLEVLDDVELIGMSPVEFAEFLSQIDTSVLDEVLAFVNKKLTEANAAIETAKLNAKMISMASTQVSMRIKAERPDMTNQEAIKAAIASSQKARAERAALTNEALKGLSVKDLDPRAPIDKAFARKNTRGTQRPVN